MQSALDWFDIVVGVVGGLIAVALLWAPIPRGWTWRSFLRLRQAPLRGRLTWFLGVEILCLAAALEGIGGLGGASWWWTKPLYFAGFGILIFSVFRLAPQRASSGEASRGSQP